MIALYLWAVGALGVLPGIAIGFGYGWSRGHSAGVAAGQQSSASWSTFVKSQGQGYQKTLPHYDPDHVCSTTCRPGMSARY